MFKCIVYISHLAQLVFVNTEETTEYKSYFQGLDSVSYVLFNLHIMSFPYLNHFPLRFHLH